MDTSKEEKEYNTLYDELHDKCNPEKFMEPYEKEKVDVANEIYAELVSRQGCSDENIVDLRNKAIRELGIRISTHKLFAYLDKYLNPKVYMGKEPYDKERVSQANGYYSRMQTAKNDIIALEQIQQDAHEFIEKKIEEDKVLQTRLKQWEESRKRYLEEQ